MITTTYAAIRDRQIRLIEALVPAVIPKARFRRGHQHIPLKTWASTQGVGSAALRRFEIVRNGVSDPPLLDPAAREVREETLISVAYPTLAAHYGPDRLDDLEEIMRSDARQIRDVVFSYANYLPGQSLAQVTILQPDRAFAPVWFQDFSVSLIYTEAQSL